MMAATWRKSQHHESCFRMKKHVVDQLGRDKKDKRSVDTLIYDIVSGLRQWEGVERWRGGEREVVGSKSGLSRIHLLPP
jgi:hypothetical protein